MKDPNISPEQMNRWVSLLRENVPEAPPLSERLSIQYATQEAESDLYESRYDGFVGRRIGEYRTLEGNEGLVLQQVGSKVVHVYQMKHLIPMWQAPEKPIEVEKG